MERRISYAVVESGKRYDANTVMSEVGNFRPTPEGDLRALYGQAALVPNYGDGYPSPWAAGTFGLYHTELWGASRNNTLMRCGSALYEQAGWNRGLRTLATGLCSGPGHYPDCFVRVGERVVWMNGVDRPLAYDGELCTPLGYVDTPAAPQVRGPQAAPTSSSDSSQNPQVYRNAGGYSHPGAIGTPGDTLNGQWGAVLDGAWYYRCQWEDAFGNLSPLSGLSVGVTLRTEQSATEYNTNFLAWSAKASLRQYAVQLNDLTKQFFVQVNGAGPDGTVAVHIHRTADTRYNTSEPRRLTRVEGYHERLVYPDNTEDALLGEPALEVLPVPSARIGCAHSGRLVLGNTAQEPGAIWVSLPGATGTFPVSLKGYPDSAAGAVTGLASSGGLLLAFTEARVYTVELGGTGLQSVELASTGCVAPSSVTAIGRGGLIWLGPDGCYYWKQGEAPALVSDGIADLLRLQSRSRSRWSCGVWDSLTAEYLLSVSVSGSVRGGLLMGWDGVGWRRYDVPPIWSMAACVDFRRYILLGCATRVFVFDAIDPGEPVSNSEPWFLTRWLTADDEGRVEFNLTEVQVGFVGASVENLTYKVWKNNDPLTLVCEGNMQPCYPTDSGASALTLGSDVVTEDGIVWRKMSLAVSGARTVRLSIRGASNQQKLRVAGFTFEIEPVDEQAHRVRK